MDVVVGEDDVENPKPHPEPLFKALDHLGVSAGEAIYVGDSVHDMYAGRAAGVLTAAVLWGPFRRSHLEPAAPDYWLERPAQLLQLARELGQIM
jgi:pyrophosphatase PpaX